MFGHHKQKRAKKRNLREQEKIQKEKADWEKNSPQREQEAEEFKKKQVADKASQSAADRAAAREEGKKYAEEILNRDVQGLDPEKRKALQYEANKAIHRDMQSSNRKLLGEQNLHGIQGKGGVGYAQQRDLQKIGSDAKAQAYRDLEKLDADLALKNRAAMFNIEQGEASQAALDKQAAIDELNLLEEQKRNKRMEEKIDQLFSRI